MLLRRSFGFSLIELMVTLAVAAVLLVAAVPAVMGWIADAKVRSAAESFQNAARLAQAEAVRRSRSSVLLLTGDSPSLDAEPSDNGQRWVVRLLERKTKDDGEEDLYLRGGGEAASAGVSVTGEGLTCFNALGQQVTIDDDDTGLEFGCNAPSGDEDKAFTFSLDGARTLKVLIGHGGKVRMCDAEKTLSDSQLDGCPSTSP